MSDNLKRYRAICSGLKQFFPQCLTPRQWQHFQVMAAMINGIVGSRHVNLPKMADKFPSKANRESRIKRFARWLQNETINQHSYFAPFAQALLATLASQPLVLVMDGSTVGRGCQWLMLSVIYRNRALPLGWIVFEGSKGHSGQARHLELLRQVEPLIPNETTVILLGDGEFDGVEVCSNSLRAGVGDTCVAPLKIRCCTKTACGSPVRIGARIQVPVFICHGRYSPRPNMVR